MKRCRLTQSVRYWVPRNWSRLPGSCFLLPCLSHGKENDRGTGRGGGGGGGGRAERPERTQPSGLIQPEEATMILYLAWGVIRASSTIGRGKLERGGGG